MGAWFVLLLAKMSVSLLHHQMTWPSASLVLWWSLRHFKLGRNSSIPWQPLLCQPTSPTECTPVAVAIAVVAAVGGWDGDGAFDAVVAATSIAGETVLIIPKETKKAQ